MRRVLALAVALTLGGVAGWVVYTWPTTVQYLPYFSVTYSKGIGKELVVEVVNQHGFPAVFCVTLYGWLPNGTFQEVGWGCGVGAVALDKEPLDRYVRSFADKQGEVGVVVFLTYIDDIGRGGLVLARHVSGFTVSPGRALASDKVVATIVVRSGGGGALAWLLFPQWPPAARQVHPAVALSMCSRWVLDRVYVKGSGGIPIAAVRVPSDYEKIYIVFASAYLHGDLYLYFKAGAAVRYHNVTESFLSNIPIYALTHEKKDIVLRKTIVAFEIGRPFILAVGFYGDYAVVGFREVKCGFAGSRSTGYAADVYMVRPWLNVNGSLMPYVEVDDTIYDDSGASAFVNTAVGHLEPVRVEGMYGDYLRVDNAVGRHNEYAVDPLPAAIPLPRQAANYVSPSITAGIGQAAWAQTFVLLMEDYRSTYYIWGEFYKPPVRYADGGDIPVLYVSVYVTR